MTVIEVTGLRRTYRTRVSPWRSASKEVEAVRGVDFAVERGELFGLLGPERRRQDDDHQDADHAAAPDVRHGAGARVRRGRPTPREVRRRVGYVFGGDRGLYERLSGLDNLRYFAELYGVPPREQRARIGELLELVGLDRSGEGAGRGLLARHAAAAAHRPRPAAPTPRCSSSTSRRSASTRSAPASCAARWPACSTPGTTVLLTTHYMFEADELCDRIAVIADGPIVAEGTPADLKSRVGEGPVVEVEVFGAADGAARARSQALTGVRSALVEERGQAQVLVVQARPGRGGDPAGARLPRRRPRSAGSPPASPPSRTPTSSWWARRDRDAPGQDARRSAGGSTSRCCQRSAFDGILGVLWPLFFATIAFLMYRIASDDRTLLYAAVGASVMGIWSSVSTSAQRCRCSENAGRAPSSCWSPRRCRFRWCCCRSPWRWRHRAGYSMVVTLLWGRFLFGIEVSIAHPLLFLLSLPVTVVSVGAVGFLLSVTVVRYRSAWALGSVARAAGLAGLRLPGADRHPARLGAPARPGCWPRPGASRPSGSRRWVATRCPSWGSAC